jgi:hypothetical protein
MRTLSTADENSMRDRYDGSILEVDAIKCKLSEETKKFK